MMGSIFEGTMMYDNWLEVRKAAVNGEKVLFPIGVVEEHGPHIPLGADIYHSCAMCNLVREKLKSKGVESVVAPPYYWGVNHCTGAFPGSFSLKPETMQQVLFETFENFKSFGFAEIYCFNYHNDAVHTGAIAEAIKRANSELDLRVKLAVEEMDIEVFGWKKEDDFLVVFSPDYPAEWFDGQEESEKGLLDIHAGAFETAVIDYICPNQVDLDVAQMCISASLDYDRLGKWLQGGKAAVEAVPLGYAGNPAGYRAVSAYVAEMLDLQAETIAQMIICD